MANRNNTRAGTAHLKKTLSLFAVAIGAEQAADYADASGNYLVGYLPADAVIVDAKVATKVASDAGAVTVGTTEGGSEILTAGDSTTPGLSGTFAGESMTNTGVPVFVNLDAVVTAGDFHVIIEYQEYTLANGDMTVVDNI